MVRSTKVRVDKKAIRAAIKSRIDERNRYNQGGGGFTRWNAPIPEWHFYLRNNGIEIKWTDGGGTIEMKGEVIATFIRKWSTRKVCLCYAELMPTIEWRA